MSIRFNRVLRLLLTISAGVTLAGCADAFTFSQDFKREGIRQYDAGEYMQAAGAFRAAAKQDPTDYQTQYYLASSYEKAGQNDQAVESYKLCLKLMSQTVKGRADASRHDQVLDRLATLIGKSDSAEPQIDAIQAEAGKTNSAEDYRLLARIFAARGDADSAVDDYRRALSFDGDNFGLAKEYGLYLAKLNQTTEAARVLKQAYRMNPSDREVIASLRRLGVSDAQLNGSSANAGAPTATPVVQTIDTPRD